MEYYILLSYGEPNNIIILMVFNLYARNLYVEYYIYLQF